MAESDQTVAKKEQEPHFARMADFAKIYVQGPLKRTETEFYTLLPTLLALGCERGDIICSPPPPIEDLKCETIFNVYDPFLQRGKIPPFTSKAAHLPLGDIARVLNFTSILQNAVALDLPETSIVFIIDSRAIVRRDFFHRMRDLVQKESGSNWECISLAHIPSSLPPDADTSYFSDPQVYEQEPMTPITTWALALRLSFVKKLVKTVLPFRDTVDFELVFQTLLHKTKPYFVYPPMFDCGRC